MSTIATEQAQASGDRRLPMSWIESPALRRAAVLVFLAAIWEGYARWLDNSLLFPSLSATLWASYLSVVSGELPSRIANSLELLAIGYGAGVLIAVILTSLAVSTRLGTDLLGMLASMFNPLPPIALLPMAVLWFGIGQPSIIFITLFSVTWVVAVNAQSGFQAVAPALRMTGQNIGLRGWRYVVHILIPAALPSILTGLKIGWAFAWRALIAAELVFGASSHTGGLGWFIAEHRNALEIEQVFAGLLAAILIGLVIEIGLFRFIEQKTVFRWGMQH